jgi:hypothetical protein
VGRWGTRSLGRCWNGWNTQSPPNIHYVGGQNNISPKVRHLIVLLTLSASCIHSNTTTNTMGKKGSGDPMQAFRKLPLRLR